MAHHTELPLYKKLYALIKALYDLIRSFPKEHKYVIGQDILLSAWRCLNLVIEINPLPDEAKKPLKHALIVDYDKLKLRLRMAAEIGLIKEGQFVHLQENYVLEIGRMIGGWGRGTQAAQAG
jgi:hypothetical protein